MDESREVILETIRRESRLEDYSGVLVGVAERDVVVVEGEGRGGEEVEMMDWSLPKTTTWDLEGFAMREWELAKRANSSRSCCRPSRELERRRTLSACSMCEMTVELRERWWG